MEQDAGRSIEEANAVLISQYPEWKKEIKAYYGRWPEMLGDAIHGSVEILKQCIGDRRFSVLALTNWSAETFPIAQKKFDFLSWFEGIVMSGEENCRKPFPEIYQILLERYNLVPSETLFIDDSEANVVAAREHGIHAIHFVNADKLAEEFQLHGISFSKTDGA